MTWYHALRFAKAGLMLALGLYFAAVAAWHFLPRIVEKRREAREAGGFPLALDRRRKE